MRPRPRAARQRREFAAKQASEQTVNAVTRRGAIEKT
jgi:hypothetical protein